MNLEKVVYGFFVLLALTLNFGFVIGDISQPSHHHVYELYAAIVVSLLATALKLGDHTHLGSVLLASSLVADLQLVAAAVVWGITTHVYELPEEGTVIASVVSLAYGALIANLVSVVLLVIDTANTRR